MMWLWIIIGIIFLILGVFALCACMLSSIISREEEEFYSRYMEEE
jgi:hypothetical protein